MVIAFQLHQFLIAEFCHDAANRIMTSLEPVAQNPSIDSDATFFHQFCLLRIFKTAQRTDVFWFIPENFNSPRFAKAKSLNGLCCLTAVKQFCETCRQLCPRR